MKKSTLFQPVYIAALLLTACFGVSAQERSLMNAVTDASVSKQLKTNVSSHQLIRPDSGALHQLMTERPLKLALDLPFEGRIFHLILEQNQILNQGFSVKTNSKNKAAVPYNPGLCYHGKIEGVAGSMAAISFFDDNIIGVFAGTGGNFVIGKLQDNDNSKGKKLKPAAKKPALYVVYNDKDVLNKPAINCTELQPKSNWQMPLFNPGNSLKSFPSKAASECRSISIHFECDNIMFTDFGSNITNTVNYAIGLFNVVSELYYRESVRVSISDITVNTEPDNYDLSSSAAYLYEFQGRLGSNFTGELAHGLTTSLNGLGGIAFLDVVCQKENAHGISNIDPYYFNLPAYSWSAMVVTHELGHNVGSPHTQNCGWDLGNGVFGMIDSCYIPEGGCYDGPQMPRTGTIMSYCHQNGRIDLNLGFGPLPGNVIRNTFTTYPCLSGEILPFVTATNNGPACAGNSVNLTATDVPFAIYQWSGPGGFSATGRNQVISNISAGQQGDYAVTVMLNGCSSIAVITNVSVKCLPLSNIKVQRVCKNDFITFDAGLSTQFNAGNNFTIHLSPVSGTGASFDIPAFNTSATPGSFTATPENIPAGDYTISLNSTSPAFTGTIGKYPVTIRTPAVSEARNYIGCIGSSVTLNGSIANAGNIWYDGGMNYLSNTPTYTTTPLNNNETYYLSQAPVIKANVGPASSDIGEGAFRLPLGTGNYVTVKTAVTIDSVTFYTSSGGDVVINFVDSVTFAPRFSKTIYNVEVGYNRRYVGLNVLPGRYLVTPYTSTVDELYRTSSAAIVYPYTAAEAFSITGSTGGRTFYYFFYNYALHYNDCPSEPVAHTVTAISQERPAIAVAGQTTFCYGDSVILSAVNSAGAYIWSNGATTRTIAARNGGNYRVQTISGACTSASSEPVFVDVLISNFTSIRGSICRGLIYSFDSALLTEPGTYTINGHNRFGCDSIVTLILEVNDLPAAPAVNYRNDSLITDGTGVIQWLLDGNPVPGANNFIYIPTVNGPYSVRVTDVNGCSSQSLTIPVVLGISNTLNSFTWNIYPNPAVTEIQLSNLATGTSVQIINQLGQMVMQSVWRGNPLSVGQLPAGLYCISAKGKGVNRFIKTR
ncbi:MAG: M12 family metallo-peptidase [Bacteroidota bacterium]